MTPKVSLEVALDDSEPEAVIKHDAHHIFQAHVPKEQERGDATWPTCDGDLQ